MLDFSFPSSGDPVQDAATAASIRQHAAREAEGLCPNGCGPVRWLDDHTRECAACGFTGWVSTPNKGRVE